MRIARISEQERKTTQSGKANAGKWLLELERQQPLRPDPLTGWNGSGDTGPQVRLFFQTKDAAIAYCKKHDLKHHLVTAPPVRLKLPNLRRQFPLRLAPGNRCQANLGQNLPAISSTGRSLPRPRFQR